MRLFLISIVILASMCDYSYGWHRQVSIAVALMAKPQVQLADTSLEPGLKAQRIYAGKVSELVSEGFADQVGKQLKEQGVAVDQQAVANISRKLFEFVSSRSGADLWIRFPISERRYRDRKTIEPPGGSTTRSVFSFESKASAVRIFASGTAKWEPDDCVIACEPEGLTDIAFEMVDYSIGKVDNGETAGVKASELKWVDSVVKSKFAVKATLSKKFGGRAVRLAPTVAAPIRLTPSKTHPWIAAAAILPGDVLSIHLPESLLPGTEDIELWVNQHSTVSLPPVGILEVGGLTEEGLAHEIERKLATLQIAQQPKVSVHVVGSGIQGIDSLRPGDSLRLRMWLRNASGEFLQISERATVTAEGSLQLPWFKLDGVNGQSLSEIEQLIRASTTESLKKPEMFQVSPNDRIFPMISVFAADWDPKEGATE